MHFLVTGGAGFIGSHVAEKLVADGHHVTIFDDFNDFYAPEIKRRNIASLLSRENVTLIEADICDSTALDSFFGENKVDQIVHLAARAGVRPSLQQPLLYSRVNVLGTQNLLESARKFGVKKFIFGSSSSVYGVNQKIPFSESDPIFQPISPYAATKLAGEALCHVYHHLYEIDIVCLRFFTVYGARQRPDLAIHKFTRAIAAGMPIEVFGDGSARRDYTYIDDILQGVLAAAERNFGYEIINLGESETTELTKLIQLIEKSLGKKAKIQRLPPQPGDVPVTFADIAKARKLLGYNPQTKIEDGIPKFVEWFRKQS
jgi:UDP-glucuronate 4-epimerase